jgi:hypothetical protein
MEVLYKGIVNGVTARSATIQFEDGSIVFYRDWTNDKGKIIDCAIETKGGYNITLEDWPDMYNKICDYVDSNDIF